MTRIITTLLASSLLLAGCFSEKTDTVDVTELRVQCEKESGFSGESMLVPETRTVFVWRADGEEVAECANGKLVGILGHNHPADL
jgi:hypothetical protein